MRGLRIGVVLLLVALTTGACGLFGPDLRTTPRTVMPEEEYRVGIEDSLTVTVWKDPALSRSAVVRPDGKISLPLLNDIQVVGLTTTELKVLLEKKFSEFVPNPEVYITVSGIRGFDVMMLGDGAKIGRYTLKRPTTLMELIALSGGLTQFASKRRIVILRKDGNETRRIPYNYDRVLRGDDPDIVLKPDDVVLIP